MQLERKISVSVPLATAEAEHKRDACATSERGAQVAELVKSGLERDPREWPSFLDETCGSDVALRAEVESLLQFKEEAIALMQEPAVHLSARIFVPDRELKPEEIIGDYRILSHIGSGGMATFISRKISNCIAKSRSKSSGAVWTRATSFAAFSAKSRFLPA